MFKSILQYKPSYTAIIKSLVFISIFLFPPIHFTYGQKQYRDSLSKLLDESKNKTTEKADTAYINSLNLLAYRMRYYNLDSLLLLSDQAMAYSKDIAYDKGYATSAMGLGIYYSHKGSQQKSLDYFLAAYDAAKKIGENELILEVQVNLAQEYGYKGEYAKALRGYLESIALAESTNDYVVLGAIYQNIADLYSAQKDYAQALMYYGKVKEIDLKLDEPLYYGVTSSNLAHLYVEIGELDKAIKDVNKSIAIFKEQQSVDWLAFALIVKGNILLKQQNYSGAIEEYHKSENLHKGLDDKMGQIELFNGLAEAYFAIEEFDLAKNYAGKASNLSNNILLAEGIQKSAHTLYKIYKKENNLDNALYYHEKFQQISDTLNKDENKRGLAFLKTTMAFDEEKKELIEKNESALTKQRNMIYGALIGLAFLFLFLLWERRSAKKQKILAEELKTGKEALEKTHLKLYNLNQTKDQLFSIIGHDLKGPINAFEGLLQLFDDGQVSDTEFLSVIPQLRSDIKNISFTLNNLLYWAQAQMKGMVTKPGKLHLTKIAGINIQLLSESAAKKGIDITNNIPENAMAWADSNQMDIIIRNLLSNALKFTRPQGRIIIGAKQKKEFWEVEIKDDGVGIGTETLNKLFSNESSITTYGTNDEKGTGLGLSLCREMVAKNNGVIHVESVLGEGSTFYFTVPKYLKNLKRTG